MTKPLISDNSLVTIVMPAFNAEETILRAIRSVIVQTYQNFQLFVIDDCSIDSTREVLCGLEDTRIIFLRNQKNIGAAATRNRGIQLAEGRFLAFLDADDVWVSNKLELQVAHMKLTGSVLSTHAYRVRDRNGRSFEFFPPAKVSYRKLLKFNVISNCATMIDRSRLQEDVFFKQLRSRQDHAMSLEITKKYGPATSLKSVLLEVYLQPKSISSDKKRALIDQWILYRKVEQINIIKSTFLICIWALSGIKKYSRIGNKRIKGFN